MKKYDDNRSLIEGLKVSCHTKFRFAEGEAQYILGECGPLNLNSYHINYNYELLFNLFGYDFISDARSANTQRTFPKLVLS